MTKDDKIVIRFLKEELKNFKSERKQLIKDKYYRWASDAELLIDFCEKHINLLKY